MVTAVDINFVKLVLAGTIRGKVRDSYALFRCRESFQAMLQRVSGCGGKECIRCREGSCAFGCAFLQPLGSDPAAVKRHQKPPVPFAFSFPALGDSPVFEVGLTLVGAAISHAPLFVESFAMMLGELRLGGASADLTRVESEGYWGERSPYMTRSEIPEDEVSTILSVEGLMKSRVMGESLTLTIETPMRIIQDGAPLRTFSFSTMVRPLMRRVSALASAYCAREIDDDFRWLARLSADVKPVNQAIRWTDWRESDHRGRYGGLIGDAVFATNDLEEFLPYLLAGEYLGAGKGASFGMGRFRLHGEAN